MTSNKRNNSTNIPLQDTGTIKEMFKGEGSFDAPRAESPNMNRFKVVATVTGWTAACALAIWSASHFWTHDLETSEPKDRSSKTIQIPTPSAD